MKKIGLITFHTSINYGVYLQAYALQTFIEGIGYEVEIINYNRLYEKGGKKKGVIYRLTHLQETFKIIRMIYFLHEKKSIEKENKFRDFALANFHLSKPMNTIDDIIKEQTKYDKFVCGSDQIWNPEYTQANPVYFLCFAPREKRIAYAPSFGVGQSSEAFCNYTNQYKDYLSNFSAISVREKTGQLIVQDFANIMPSVVVDPTLLLSVDYWEGKSKKVELGKRKYVLFYVLSENKMYRKLACKIAAQGQYMIVCIPTGPLWNNLKCVKKSYAGVDEFLYLMKNAEYVITDSFHGTVFSVIFQKNFSAILRNDTSHSLCSRLEDFLGRVCLQKNCVNVSDILDIDVDYKTNYKDSIDLLHVWINESKNYIINALSKGDISE